MKIALFVVGKTNQDFLAEGIAKYQKRLQHYIKFEIFEISNIKNAKKLSNFELKKKEGELILKQIQPADYLVLLDEKGKDLTSVKFAKNLQLWMLTGKKRIVFVCGGAYGFSDALYQRKNETI